MAPSEKLLVGAAWAAAIALPAVLAPLAGYLVWRAWPAIDLALLFGDTPPLDVLLRGAPVFDGIWPACLGTLVLVLLACALAVPLGVAAGVYLAETTGFARGRTRAAVALAVDVLAGVPSIVMGLFGFALILLLRRSVAPQANTGLLLSAVCLALLVLPYVISATRLALEGLPPQLRLTGASLGLTPEQAVVRILLPAAAPGIFAGVVLALGRAAEDTAVILLTGVVANAGNPSSLTGKYEALPFHIYYLAAEYQTPAELAQAFASALVLVLLTTALGGAARALQRRLAHAWSVAR